MRAKLEQVGWEGTERRKESFLKDVASLEDIKRKKKYETPVSSFADALALFLVGGGERRGTNSTPYEKGFGVQTVTGLNQRGSRGVLGGTRKVILSSSKGG